MNKEALAQRLDGVSYPPDSNIHQELIQAAKDHGLVIVYGLSDDLMELNGAISDEFGCFDGGTAFVDAKGLVDRDQVDDDDDQAIAEYVERKKSARAIEALWAAEPGTSWTYRTDIPHVTFNVMEDGEIYCRGIVFALSDLDPEMLDTGTHQEGQASHHSSTSSVYEMKLGGPNAATVQVHAAPFSEVNAEELARRIAVCLNACEGVPTDELDGKHLTEYVAEQAFLTGMQPLPDEPGFEIGLKGIACQLMAASFAGQFKGSGATNYLEVRMSHPEIGPFLVNVQRCEGKTPGVLRHEALMQRDKAIAAATFFKGLIEGLSPAERERAGLSGLPDWAENERLLLEAKEDV